MKTFLVIVDESEEFLTALAYAARRAKAIKGRVALLYVVEPQNIETWSSVEQAVTDEAFDAARKEMARYEKIAQNISKAKPLTFYRKGERHAMLIDLIDSQPDISTLVLAAQMRAGGHNPLIQYFMSDKGMKKLKIPLVIVPETMRSDDAIDS